MEYYKQTSPLIGYYYVKKIICRVDGLADIKTVESEIAEVLDRVAKVEA